MPEIPAGVRWNRNPLGGFLLHRDCPEDFAPGFCFKFPRWGILRRRTNLIFPQVSRTLHRLTRHALPPERILTQPAPYLRPEGHRFTEHLDKLPRGCTENEECKKICVRGILPMYLKGDRNARIFYRLPENCQFQSWSFFTAFALGCARS